MYKNLSFNKKNNDDNNNNYGQFMNLNEKISIDTFFKYSCINNVVTSSLKTYNNDKNDTKKTQLQKLSNDC